MSTVNTTNLKNPSSGSNNIVLAVDGSATIATLSSTTITGTTIQGTIKSGTAVASTSGTSIDFTSIPSWVKRITVMFDGVSTNGTATPLIQLGTAGGIASSGYTGTTSYITTGSGSAYFTSGFGINNSGASNVMSGVLTLVLLKASTNTWAAFGVFGLSAGVSATQHTGGSVTLSGVATTLRITTSNGTDTFDAGSINILYEG